MTIQLRLDADALASLFPEGSEARIELQRAVVAEFARKHLGKLVPEEVQTIVRKAQKEAVTEILREYRIVNQWGNATSELTESFKTTMKAHVRDAVSAEINTSLKLQIDSINKDLLNTMPSYIERQVEVKTNEMIATAVRARFEEAFKTLKI